MCVSVFYIMLLRCFSVASYVRISFSFIAELYPIIWKYHHLFSHSLTDGNLSCLQLGSVINKSIMNIHICISVWTYIICLCVNTENWNPERKGYKQLGNTLSRYFPEWLFHFVLLQALAIYDTLSYSTPLMALGIVHLCISPILVDLWW